MYRLFPVPCLSRRYIGAVCGGTVGGMGAKDLQLRMSLQNSQDAWHAR